MPPMRKTVSRMLAQAVTLVLATATVPAASVAVPRATNPFAGYQLDPSQITGPVS